QAATVRPSRCSTATKKGGTTGSGVRSRPCVARARKTSQIGSSKVRGRVTSQPAAVASSPTRTGVIGGREPAVRGARTRRTKAHVVKPALTAQAEVANQGAQESKGGGSRVVACHAETRAAAHRSAAREVRIKK